MPERSAERGERDSGVAARRFDDAAARRQQITLVGSAKDVERHAIFDASREIHRLELRVERALRSAKAEVDRRERGVADERCERINLIRSLGADIELVSKEDGGFLGSIERAEALGRDTPGSFLPRQFSNEFNAEAHELTTGPEIAAQLRSVAPRGPDAFVAGVGTGGTVMGVGRFLRGCRRDVRVHPLEPSNSPTLSTGFKVGRHRIQGISDEFVPAIVDLEYLDRVIAVDDGDAILMAQALASSIGLAVGISSGANFLGALLAQEALGPDAVVATVFSDSNKKYLSTDLMRDEPVRPGFLSPDVRLRRYRILPRRCEFCPPSITSNV